MKQFELLYKEVQKVFSDIFHPEVIYSLEPYVTKPDSYRLKLQEEFGAILQGDLDKRNASQILLESVLISDQAIKYFLPKLTELFFYNELDPYFFYARLENISVNNLTKEQTLIINQLIKLAKEKEEYYNKMSENEAKGIIDFLPFEFR